ACQSPVWDTVLAVVALADAGLPPDHATLTTAAGWLLDEEITGPGDWQVRRPELATGGWAFEFDNDTYPDIDDTAEIVLALRRARCTPARTPWRLPSIGGCAGWLACSPVTGAGGRSTPTTPPRCRPNCRSAISARSWIHPRP